MNNPHTMNRSKVTICLVTLNGERYIDHCISSLLAQTFQDFTILVLDNGSQDHTADLIYQHYPMVKLIKKTNNIGFAAAHNMLITLSESEYVFLVNQDMIFEPDYLKNIINILDTHHSVGSASGVLYRWKFNNEINTGEKTNEIDSAGLALARSLRISEIIDLPKEQITHVFGVSGAAPIYRRIALMQVIDKNQIFDESFFAYKEDVDLAWRLQHMGWQSIIVRDAHAYHDRSFAEPRRTVSLWRWIKTKRNDHPLRAYWSFRNHIYLLIKNVPFWLGIRVFFPFMFFEIKRFLFALFFKPHLLKSYREVCINLVSLLRKRRIICSTTQLKYSSFKKFIH